jgi:beta-carotene 15,15'-monooxygenase
VNGSFIRVGPGKFDFENTHFTVNHWLDGYALLTKFEISSTNQSVTYCGKYLQSEAYKKAVRAGKPLITEFATKAFPDPDKNIFTRFFSSLVCNED